jgi:MEMO1 family protein
MERYPAVAGVFYPADSLELEKTLQELVGKPLGDEKALAIIAPHAGYVYSGAIAGEVYRQIRVPSVAVVLCPNHTGLGARDAIMSQGVWSIPTCHIPIEQTLAEAFRKLAKLSEDHRAHQREHSAEVQLPFLAFRNPHLSLVPVCMGYMPFERCQEIGEALADAISSLPNRDQVLIVASTDMSHYLPSEVARIRDNKALERVMALDASGLYHTVLENDISMCGFIPTATALVAAKKLGASTVRLVRYGNSGDVSGDYQRVVGYAGLVVS